MKKSLRLSHDERAKRVYIIRLLDRIPRIYRPNKTDVIEEEISWLLRGNIYDSRSYLVSNIREGNVPNSWLNYKVRIRLMANQNLYIDCVEDEGGVLTREQFFLIMPEDVKEEFIYQMDVFI